MNDGNGEYQNIIRRPGINIFKLCVVLFSGESLSKVSIIAKLVIGIMPVS